MNTPPQPTSGAATGARVLRGPAAAGVQPLYPTTRLLKGAVLEAEHLAGEARRAVDAARAEAAAIREAAAADADAVRREAFARGTAEASAAFAQTLLNFQRELDRLKKQFTLDVQRLAFKIAKLVLKAEIEVRPERVVALVAGVLERAKHYNRVTVHLHPDDVERVRPHQAALAEQLTFCRDLQFRPDDDLPPHAVRVETEMGTYDGSIDVQLKRLQAHLLGGPAADDGVPGDAAGGGGASGEAGDGGAR